MSAPTTPPESGLPTHRQNVALFSANVTADRRDAGERETVAAAPLERASTGEAARTTRWTNWQRWFAVVGAIILIGNFTLGLCLAFRH